MAKKDAKPKKQSTIKQIIQIYKYTAKEDKALPWLEAGAFLLPVVVMIIIGLIAKWTWLTWIFTMITAIMLGMLLATMMLTRRADAVGYKQIDGKPGAAIGVLSNMQKAGFDFPQEPVWIDPKTKDAIWRGTSMNGIYPVSYTHLDVYKRQSVTYLTAARHHYRCGSVTCRACPAAKPR